MEAVIINRKGSSVAQEVSHRLLWFAILLFEKINYIATDSMLFDIDGLIKLMSVEEKYKLLREHAPGVNPALTERELAKMYFEYDQLKKIKHKDKYTLLYFMNLEHSIHMIETGIRNDVANVAEKAGLKILIEMNKLSDGNFINLKLPCTDVSKRQQYNNSEETISRIITQNSAVPFFDLSIKRSLFYKDATFAEPYNGELIIFDKPMIKIPSPENYTLGELRQKRHESTTRFNEILDKLEFTYEDAEPTEEEIALLEENQAILDKSEEILSRYPIPKDFEAWGSTTKTDAKENLYPVYHGMCSKDTLLKIYREFNLIDEKCETNIRKLITDPRALGNCCPLLALDLG